MGCIHIKAYVLLIRFYLWRTTMVRTPLNGYGTTLFLVSGDFTLLATKLWILYSISAYWASETILFTRPLKSSWTGHITLSNQQRKQAQLIHISHLQIGNPNNCWPLTIGRDTRDSSRRDSDLPTITTVDHTPTPTIWHRGFFLPSLPNFFHVLHSQAHDFSPKKCIHVQQFAAYSLCGLTLKNL